MWAHLLALATGPTATTTIITTHYVEEARGAAKVGFMRDGRLLAEDSPEVGDGERDGLRGLPGLTTQVQVRQSR